MELGIWLGQMFTHLFFYSFTLITTPSMYQALCKVLLNIDITKTICPQVAQILRGEKSCKQITIVQCDKHWGVGLNDFLKLWALQSEMDTDTTIT